MSMLSGPFGICLLVSTLTLVGAGWAQTIKSAVAGHATLYGRAVSLLDQAQQELDSGNLSGAKALAEEANSLFTILKNGCASKLAQHELSPQEDQQLAINQKLAADAQAQADRLMATAAAQDRKAQELETQGREEASQAAYRQSQDGYNRARSFYIRSLIYALRNQQLLFRFLAP